MNKILNIITFAAAVSLVSCELDKEPEANLPQSAAFSSVTSIGYLEDGAYSRLRAAYNVPCMIVPDLQADYVHACDGFSNTYGEVYKWSFRQNDYDVADAWNYLYAGIGQFNYVIDGIEHKLGFKPTDAEQAALDGIRGRMYLMRAMSYSLLCERFCADYDAATAKKEYSGVPLITTYTPADKPSRATLYDVYDQILKDLQVAKGLLAGQRGKANAIRLNIDCVTALEAHVCLQMDNYTEALAKANELIGNAAYALVDSQEELEDMWLYDTSSEIIFSFYASKTELPAQFGLPTFEDYYSGQQAQSLMLVDYIPTQSCLDAYDASDWRRSAYFLDASITTPVDGRLYLPLLNGIGAYAFPKLTLISKYSGNPNLRTSSAWNTRNTFKVFRLAEMYLIAAEAAAQLSGDAKTPLNALRTHRGLEELATVTLADVKQERYRELLLEGMRLVDLKRWGDGMVRGQEQGGYVTDGADLYEGFSYIVDLSAHISVSASDYRFVWPIPANEIFANQKLANQQNPGWER